MQAQTRSNPVADTIAPTREGAQTMRAVVQRSYGSTEALQLDEIAYPEVEADQVLIKVHAARPRPWRLAPHDGQAISAAAHGLRHHRDRRTRCLGPTWPVTSSRSGETCSGSRWATRSSGSLGARTRSTRWPRKQAGAQAGLDLLRAGGGRPDLRDHRAPGAHRGREGRGRTSTCWSSAHPGAWAALPCSCAGPWAPGSPESPVPPRRTWCVRSARAARHRLRDGRLSGRIGQLRPDRRHRRPSPAAISCARRSLTAVPSSSSVEKVETDGPAGSAASCALHCSSLFTSQRLTMFISAERQSDIERLAEYMARGEVMPMVGPHLPARSGPAGHRRPRSGTSPGQVGDRRALIGMRSVDHRPVRPPA